MTTIVSLYGGPGTGKSTNAAKLFAAIKSIEGGPSAELNQEYVKQWAWEKRTPVSFDQFYFFGKQTRKEYSLFGQVDFVITDAPVLLTCYYAQVYGTSDQAALFRSMLLTYNRMCKDAGHSQHNYFLTRSKPYDPRGRFQTEDQARKIDIDLRRYMAETGTEFIELPDDDQLIPTILFREIPDSKETV